MFLGRDLKLAVIRWFLVACQASVDSKAQQQKRVQVTIVNSGWTRRSKKETKHYIARPPNWSATSGRADSGAVMPLPAAFRLCPGHTYSCCHQPSTPCSNSSGELSAVTGSFCLVLSLFLAASLHSASHIPLYLIPHFPKRESSWFMLLTVSCVVFLSADFSIKVFFFFLCLSLF